MARNNKFLYSRFSRSPKPSFHVVVKQHKGKRVLYITYGGGRKQGGGAWSENLSNVHPRTFNMISELLGESVVEDLKGLAPPPRKRKTKYDEYKKATKQREQTEKTSNNSTNS